MGEITKFRFTLALLCGTGFTCVLALLLGLSSSVVSVLTGIFLTPGGIISNLVLKPKAFSPPILILAANSFIYSAIAYAALSVLGRGLRAKEMRTATIGLVFPVAILVGLAFIPKLNPLWPRGMTELTTKESELQRALPLGTTLDRVRATFQSKGIQFQEETEASERVVLNDGKGGLITAGPGDRVVLARLKTGANQFPCGYDIRVILLFGQDERMKQQYVQRVRLCP